MEEEEKEENICEMHLIIQFTVFHHNVFLQKFQRLNYTLPIALFDGYLVCKPDRITVIEGN